MLNWLKVFSGAIDRSNVAVGSLVSFVTLLLVLVVFLMWSLIAFWHQTTQITCYKLEQICISVAIEIMKRRFGLLSRWQLRNSPGKLKCCRKSNDLSTNH